MWSHPRDDTTLDRKLTHALFLSTVRIQFDSANAFVLDAFEDWRKELDLQSFHLCAHSLGVRSSVGAFLA